MRTPSDDYLAFHFQFEIEAVHGDQIEGFVAFDDVDMLQTDGCDFKPKSAWPIISSTPGSTTPVPTEPPYGKVQLGFSFSLALWTLIFSYMLLNNFPVEKTTVLLID